MQVKLSKLVLAMLISINLVGCSTQANNTNFTQAPQNTQIVQATQIAPEQVHDPATAVTDANVALNYLKSGNERFISNTGINRTTNQTDRETLKDGQKPFAVVVTCSDSRDIPEIYFDQKLGDIFVIRNAGNISDQATLGSIEYAVEHLKTPLVLVVGHSKCGAVTAAVNGGEFPENLNFIVETIQESIDEEKDVDKAIHDNVDTVVEKIKADPVINNGSTTIVGAYYDIVSGKVTF